MGRLKDHEAGLRLHEELMLLALRDRKGSLESRAAMCHFALGGAILSELLLEGRIALSEDGKKMVSLVSSRPLHEPLLDEALALIEAAKRRKPAQRWVSLFANLRRLRHRVAERLCRLGILRDSEDKVLFFFTRKLYPTIDPSPERKLLAKIRRAIVSESKSLDERTAMLVALANATGMLRIHFERSWLKERKKRLTAISKGEVIPGAAREAVAAAQAAMIAAVTTATIAISAAHHR